MLHQPDRMSRLVVSAWMCLVGAAGCQTQNAAVYDAVQALRGIHPEKMSKPELARVNAATDRAWELLGANKDKAIPALKKEIDLVIQKKIRDDRFQLQAAFLLYSMAGLDEIATVARAVEDVDPNVSIELSFDLASFCARTKDPRALPVMALMLRTNEESPEMFFVEHVLRVPWPRSLDFTWGPYGPGACDYLMKQLQSTNRDVQQSTLYLLVSYRHMPALEVCRKWATGADQNLRSAALRALGTFAHPDDRDLLVKATQEKAPSIRFAAAYALYEYGDPDTAPALRALLGDPDPKVRVEAVAGVAHLIDVHGGVALADRLRSSPDAKEKAKIREVIESLATDVDANREKLAAGDVAEWKTATGAYWKKRDTCFDLRENDQHLTRNKFDQALTAWEKDHRLTDRKEFEWVKKRHLLAVARPSDIPRLLEVRGSLLWRHSDEVLYEVAELDRVIGILHRRKVGAKKPNE